MIEEVIPCQLTVGEGKDKRPVFPITTAQCVDGLDETLTQRANEILKECTVLYIEQSLTEKQKAQARANIGAGAELVTYYSTLSAAFYDINNDVSTNALSTDVSAKVKVFTADTGRLTVMLLDDITEANQIDINVDLDLVLNGKTLCFNPGANDTAMLVFAADTTCVIDGRVAGSEVKIENVAITSSSFSVILANGNLTVLGGTYNCTADATGNFMLFKVNTCDTLLIDACKVNMNNTNVTMASMTKVVQSLAAKNEIKNCNLVCETASALCVPVHSAFIMVLDNCTIVGVSELHEVESVAIGVNGTAYINECNISAIAAAGAYSINGYTGATITIKNSTIFADSPNFDASLGPVAIGIMTAGDVTITCIDCDVTGTHSGIQSSGNLYIQGGTYSSFSHGGFYLVHAPENDCLINSATIRAGYYAGQFTDEYAATTHRLAAFYIGSPNQDSLGISVYMDGCTLEGVCGESFVVRPGATGYTNALYISNTTNNTVNAGGVNPGMIRLNGWADNNYGTRAKMEIGMGCNFAPDNTTHPECAEETGKLYRKKHPDAICDGRDYEAVIGLIDTIAVGADTDSESYENFYLEFEQGSISSSSGQYDSDLRVRSAFVDMNGVVEVALNNSDYQMYGHFYDANKAYLGNTGGWIASFQTTDILADFPSFFYFRIVAKKADESDVVPADLVGVCKVIYSNTSNETIDVQYIESPTTAEVGQTIVVKSVDENGKPTEWECVDLPSGGGADLMLFYLNNRPFLSIDGMTWGEWAASKYNTCGVYIEDGDVLDENGDPVAVAGTEQPQATTVTIIAGTYYTTL